MSKRRKIKKAKKPLTPGKMFFKMFCITFLICAVVFTSGIGAFAALMNSAPMAPKTEEKVEPVMKTEEDLDILIPGSGFFTSDYADSKRINVLLFGNTNEGLADTIMLVSFDPENKTAAVISVPRDTYYAREGYSGGFLKINSVAHEGHIALCQAINDVLLGIPINYYAMVEYSGIEKIVDSLGGVPMNVERDMKYTSRNGKLRIDIEKGQQVLSGKKSVEFLRYRKGYSDGDLGRVHAQQEFMKSAAKQAIGPNLPSVAKTIAENVDSLISLKAIAYIAGKAVDMDYNNITTYTLPGVSGMRGGLSFYLRSDDSLIEEMLRAIYENRPFTTEGKNLYPANYNDSINGSNKKVTSTETKKKTETAPKKETPKKETPKQETPKPDPKPTPPPTDPPPTDPGDTTSP